MTSKFNRFFAVLTIIGALYSGPVIAAEAVSAKQFPTGCFYRFDKATIEQKKQTLTQLDNTLKRLNREGVGLIAKGAVIDKLDNLRPVYEKLTILDESGLIITARRVPNLYFGYQGPGPINPNIYIVINKPRVDIPESFIRKGFVVEGDFEAYADKFVAAIMENVEGAAARGKDGPQGKK
ncbi:MAG: hypothetical protein M1438_20910 [Deltaproteobacteria bacterium]|nr:hypothetical protein [Deltaproteobacteria bacterium]